MSEGDGSHNFKKASENSKDILGSGISSVFSSVFRRHTNKNQQNSVRDNKYSEFIQVDHKDSHPQIQNITRDISDHSTNTNSSSFHTDSLIDKNIAFSQKEKNLTEDLIDSGIPLKNTPQILFYDAREIVAKEGDLSLQNASIDRRIASIQKVTDIINEKAYLENLNSIWDSVSDLCSLSDEDPLIRSALFKLILALHNSIQVMNDLPGHSVKNFNEPHLIEITSLLISVTDFNSIVQSCKILNWSTNNGLIVPKDSMLLFNTLYTWVSLSIELCYLDFSQETSELITEETPLGSKNSDAEELLLNSMILMCSQVQNNYPLLTDVGVSNVLSELCCKSQVILLSGQQSFTFKLSDYLIGVFGLLNQVTNCGAIPLDTLKSVVKLICFSITSNEYREVSSKMIRGMINSSYIQEVAQCLMRMVMKKYPESAENLAAFVKNRNLAEISGFEETIIRLAVIQGAIYSICSAMAEDIFKLLNYDTAIGIFLPTLLAALQLNKEFLTNNGPIQSLISSGVPIDFNLSVYLTLKFLESLLMKNQLKELSPSNWRVIIDIFSLSSEFITSIFPNASSNDSYSQSLETFYTVLKLLCKSYESEYYKDFFWMKKSISKILFSIAKFDGFPDELAMALLNFNDFYGIDSSNSSEWQNVLFTEVETFFLNVDKNIEIRRRVVDLVKSNLFTSQDVFGSCVVTKAITRIVERLPLEIDDQIIESIIFIAERILEGGKGHEFELVLGILKSVISNFKANYEHYFSQNSTGSTAFPKGGENILGVIVNKSNIPNKSDLLTELPRNYGSQDSLDAVNASSLVDTIPEIFESSFESPSMDQTPDQFNNIPSDTESGAFDVEKIRIKSNLASIVLTKSLRTLLSSESTSSLDQTHLSFKLGYRNYLSDPQLTSKLIETILDLSSNSDVDSSVRIYYSDLQKGNPVNNWRPMVSNPVFTEEINQLSLKNSLKGPQDFDTLTVCKKWGVFNVQNYLEKMTFILFQDPSIEVVLIVAKNLEIQLSNIYLFWSCSAQIQKLVTLLTSALDTDKFGIREYWKNKLNSETRNNLVIMGYRLLTRIILYRLGKGSFKISRPCIHALNICMLELPIVFRKQLPTILTRLVQTHSALSMNVHILEFISAIARQPDMLANLVINDLKLLLQIPLNYIKVYNNQKSRNNAHHQFSPSPSPTLNSDKDTNNLRITSQPSRPPLSRSHILRKSIGSREIEKSRSSNSRESDNGDFNRAEYNFGNSRDIIQNDPTSEYYVLVMAYQAIDTIYLSLKPDKKLAILTPLFQGLLSSNSHSQDLSELNIVCIDAIFRFLFMRNDQVLARKEVVTEDDIGETDDYTFIQSFGVKTIRAQKNGRLAQIIIHRTCSMSSVTLDLPRMALKVFCENKNTYPAFIDIASSNENESFPHSSSKASGDQLPISSLNTVLHGKSVQVNVKNKLSHFPIVISSQRSFVDELTSLYPGFVGIDRPMLISHNPKIQRALNLMRVSSTIDNHKIGVIYAGPKQTTENEILSNTHGSSAYWAFIRGLGKVVRLSQVTGYSGGLDTSGSDTDGRFGIQYNDSLSNIFFHVATMMPTLDNAESGSVTQHFKKAHIGNDFVHIIFNESGDEYRFDTLASQFNFVQIIVSPGDISPKSPDLIDEFDDSQKPIVRGERLYWVRTQISPELPPIGPAMHPKLVTLSALPGLVRIASIHANIFVQVYLAIKKQDTIGYTSTWRQRLRGIRRLRDTALSNNEHSSSSTPHDLSSPGLYNVPWFFPISDVSDIASRSMNNGNLNIKTSIATPIVKSVSCQDSQPGFSKLGNSETDQSLNKHNINQFVHGSMFLSANNSPLKSGSSTAFSPNPLFSVKDRNEDFCVPPNRPKNIRPLSHLGNSRSSDVPKNGTLNYESLNTFGLNDPLKPDVYGNTAKNPKDNDQSLVNNTQSFNPLIGTDNLNHLSSRTTSVENNIDSLGKMLAESMIETKTDGDVNSLAKILDESMISNEGQGFQHIHNNPNFKASIKSDTGLSAPVQRDDYNSDYFSKLEKTGFTEDELEVIKSAINESGIASQHYVTQIDKSCLSGIDIFDPEITASKILRAVVSNIGPGDFW
ncbi:Tuberous sclerosis 2 protein-like protein [Smittium mucronatum]|uniref:Tuberous sclerosis 2 protein-like protein n=1 Tax=Smittium mucronatum TaxID=133383 RepID=A0A1R0GWW2_9FUNG|nr:Tuberous sclerosis 2 protein-like protein [Smittium mucronatum]